MIIEMNMTNFFSVQYMYTTTNNKKWRNFMRKIISATTLFTILSIAGCSEAPQTSAPINPTQEQVQNIPLSKSEISATIPGSYIVVFSSRMSEKMNTIAQERLAALETKINLLRKDHQFEVSFRYDACLEGFAAQMDEKTAQALARHPMLESIEPDRMVYAFAQTLPTGINRIDADVSSTLAGNGSGTVTGVDIYIIDTGIQGDHPDLNVKGGANFNSGNSWNDGNGHGTHVAGTAAAKDNTSYVVGVAPGADLYAVRVLSNSGSGSFSQILAGVNWVTNRKIANSSRPMVANMSLGGYVGTSAYNSLDNGIKNSITQGVVYAIAAGNSVANAVYYSPAHVTEALTVGAYSGSTNVWASFSNYGSIVDILAPGVSVLSTYRRSSTATLSGTSMSSPHVVGTAALYLSSHPGDTPTQVRTALLDASTNPSPGPNATITSVPAGTTNKSVYAGNF